MTMWLFYITVFLVGGPEKGPLGIIYLSIIIYFFLEFTFKSQIPLGWVLGVGIGMGAVG